MRIQWSAVRKLAFRGRALWLAAACVALCAAATVGAVIFEALRHPRVDSAVLAPPAASALPAAFLPTATPAATLPADLPTFGSGDPPKRSASPTQALTELKARLRVSPADTKCRIDLAALLDTNGNPSDAEDVLRAGLQRGIRKPEIYHALGTLYTHHNQFAGALEEYKIEATMRPRDYQVHLALASTYSYLEVPLDAEHEYQVAQKLNPAAPDPYLGLAFLNNSSERYPYAVKYLDQYIKRSPQPGPGYALLCRVYLNMREYDKAVEAGLKATVAMPTNGYVQYNLGQAYAYRPGANLPAAESAFRRAAELTPTWGHAHAELAHVLQMEGKLPESAAEYKQAVQLEPSMGKYRYEMGQLMVRQGDSAGGQAEIARAQKIIALNQKETQLEDRLAVQPRDIGALLDISGVCQELGEDQKARYYLGAAQHFAPKDKRVLARIAAGGSVDDSRAH